jgi:hypothetical protein
MRRTLLSSLALVAALGIASCGTSSSGVSKEDAVGCTNLLADATRTILAISSWMEQQPYSEGTESGYIAAVEVANAMTGTSEMAKELSSKSSSKTTKKVYDAVESAFMEAGLRIAARGGSFGPYESELLDTAVDSAENLEKFCGSE